MIDKTGTNNRFDLEERTFNLAKAVVEFVSNLPKTLVNNELIKQVVRSSGSVGANYIEANESVSRKDYIFRVKVCRKEAKETIYWLRLLKVKDETLRGNQQYLIGEATELMKIFGSIIEKVKE